MCGVLPCDPTNKYFILSVKMTNRYRKALKHLKSKELDEKLELLSEIPTNNISNLYVNEPGYIVQDPDVPGEVTREANFDQDGDGVEGYTGNDTTGLFDDDGTILTIEPPGDTSYVLGPMASMWYAWGNFTQIGYIRESDRRMVNLGRITGQLQNWDGVSNFTSYGQLTLEQASWFKDTPKYLNGYDNYRAFYPGPPSNTPDEYGRYLCSITGSPKPTTVTPPPRRVPDVMTGPDPTDVFAAQSDPKKKKPPYQLAQYTDDPSTWPSIKNPVRTPPPIIDPKTGWPSVPNVPRPYKGNPGGPPIRLASYNPKGQVLSENRKRILRDLKKPVETKEAPTKFKVKPKVRNNKSVGSDMMKTPDTPKEFKPHLDIWRKEDYPSNLRASQEKKNQVLELVGAAEHHWSYLIENKRKEKQEKINEMLASDFDKQMEIMYEKYKHKENKAKKLIEKARRKSK